MKFLKFLLVATVLAICIPAFAYTSKDILAGKDKRETIVVKMPVSGGTNITYLAESTVGIKVADPLWVCSKIIEFDSGGSTITIITVMPKLQSPGTNGVSLATFDYPND